MPRKTDRHAAVLNKLQSVIEHTGSRVAAERCLAIERWVKTYIRQVEYLDELQFLCNVFHDESCWSGAKLNNRILGQRLTEEKIGGVENPLSRYYMACRYCVTDKIPQLFQEQFEYYKGGFSSEEVDDDKPATRNNKYVRSELLNAMQDQDPVFIFWIDKKSGGFKEHNDAIEGFNQAVEFKWSEGVEYFYHHLSKKEQEALESIIVNAVTNLSAIQSNHNVATVLDFLLHEIITDPARHKLLLELSDKGKVIFSSLSALISWGFLDTVQSVVKHCSQEKVSMSKRNEMLSHRDYASLLFSLSKSMLENPDIGIQAKARVVIMNLLKCDCFFEHKKVAIDPLKDVLTFVAMKPTLAMLIVDWKRDGNDGDNTKKDEILDILKFARDHCSSESFIELKKLLVKNLRTVGVPGMKDNIDYGNLAEELFNELDKEPLSTEVIASGDPHSTLTAPGVSGLSGRSYNK